MGNKHLNMEELEKKLDRHLEIYTKNNKESERVADALEKLVAYSAERDLKVDEMYSFFSDGKIATKLVKMSGTLLVACGSVYLMYKNIIKTQ